MNQAISFQTATLARLYLSQGHHEEARKIALGLTGDEAALLRQELRAAETQLSEALQALLSRVQERRRAR